MLYLFCVDTGTMFTLDINLAMGTVANLKETISYLCHVPPDKQVLLISGGEPLDSNMRVCSYSAGTDENPIFLFSKSSIEAATPPSPSLSYGSDTDLREQVEGSLLMSPTYETVVTRTQLSLQFQEIAVEEFATCKHLVHDQHLQHQGWGAVVANLDDMSKAFQKRADQFSSSFRDFVHTRPDNVQLLDNFESQLSLLQRIPLLPCLVPPDGSVSQTGSQQPQHLLEWIQAQDPRSTLQQMAEDATTQLEHFHEDLIDGIIAEVDKEQKNVNNSSMKEVKGLEDRLFGLEKLIYVAEKLVQEQKEMAQGFLQNQERFCNVRDTSILPDLCNSHKQQLGLMLKRHQQLRDIRRRCMAAKEELSSNLHTRLRWIMYVEKSICDTDNKIMIHHDNLRRLRRKLDILKQMYNAPRIYASAIVEVVRRKKFSSQFLEWSKSLSENSLTLHIEEIQRRNDFSNTIENHFLHRIFSGLGDKPPIYATEAPVPFDTNLPDINERDIIKLQKTLVELQDILRVPDVMLDVSKRLSLETIKSTSSETLKSESLPSKTQLLTTGLPRILPESSPLLPLRVEKDTVVPEEQSTESLKGATATIAGSSDDTDSPSQLQFALELSDEKTDTLQSKKFYSQTEQTQNVDVDTGNDESVEILEEESNSLKEFIIHGSRPLVSVSPESQEYRTADFYIDDQPTVEATNNANSQNLRDVFDRLNKTEDKLSDVTSLLEGAQNKLQVFETRRDAIVAMSRNIHSEMLPECRTSLETMKKDLLSYIMLCNKDMDDYKTSVGDTIVTFIENNDQKYKNKFNGLNADKDRLENDIEDVRDKLAIESEKVKDAETEVEFYHGQLTNLTEKYDHLKVTSDVIIKELEARIDSEREKIRCHLSAEHAMLVATINMKTQAEVDSKVMEITNLKDNIKQVENKLNCEQQAKQKLEKDLLDKLEADKTELTNRLEENHQIKIITMQREYEDKINDQITTLTEKQKLSLEGAKQSVLEKCRTDFEREKTEVLLDVEQKHTNALTELSERLTQDKNVAIEILQTQLQSKQDEILQTEKEGYTSELSQVTEMHALEKDELEKKHLEFVSEIKKDFEQSKQDLIRQNELEKEEGKWELPSLDDYITLEEHGRLLNEMKAAYQEDKKQTLDETEKKHGHEIGELMKIFEKNRQDNLTGFAAEQQVKFNEAIGKVKAGKDNVIADLEDKVQKLLSELETDRGIAERLMSEKFNLDEEKDHALITAQRREQHIREEKKGLENEIEVLRERLMKTSHPREALGPPDFSEPSRDALSPPEDTLKPLGESIVAIKTEPDDDLQQSRVKELELNLQAQGEEVKRLEQKIMDLSLTGSTGAEAQDKVSITTCNAGDIVLLCLDDRHDHYVVFTVTNTLYFLHSDSIELLALKADAGIARKSWVLAQITDKEYCLAKKSSNRFRVPVGTKFYRVKAKPWECSVSSRSVMSVTK